MRIHNITVECNDPYPLVRFWAKVTDLQEDPENRNEPDDPEGLLVGPPGGPNMLFIKMPEGTGGASRLRLDLTPTDRPRDEDVDRLLKMGATLVADHRDADGAGWVLLADPEGNEFSVGRREEEPHADGEEAAVVPAADAPSHPPAARGGLLGWLDAQRARSAGTGRTPSALARLLSRGLRARLNQLMRLVLLVVEALIAVRILLKVTGANEHAGFATFLYKVSSPFVAPFHPVFADHLVNGHPFEVGSLLAMAVYAVLAYFVMRLGGVVVSPHR
ncbi:MAG TPA: VOC family protein [Candidatus Deferrimicrobium sp.]|nr:VOC family protein [Candidatus Deferrimicrobium sp.]